MAGMSDYLENKLIDHIFRARSFTAPTQLWVGLLTAAPSDAGGGTEVSGGSYARVTPGVNSDTAWTATQGGTPAAASNGTGGQTSNPNSLTFPAPTANWGVVTHMGIYDAVTAGNLIGWVALGTPKTINNNDPAPYFAAGSVTFTLNSGLSDYAENKLIDHIFRARSWTAPTQLWVALYTATPSDAGGGTEVSGGNYSRVTPGVNSDTAWTATQGGTPAAASSGTGGQTSNPGALNYGTPSANWGTIGWQGLFDASSAGNLIWWSALGTSKTVNNGDPAPGWPAGNLTYTLD